MGALRDLTVSQQVALLFVSLFGVLVLATFALFWRSLRLETQAQRESHEATKRDLRAVWIGACLFWVAWALGGVVASRAVAAAAWSSRFLLVSNNRGL